MMRSVAEALQILSQQVSTLEAESCRLDDSALGRVLAKPLLAPQASPRWNVSAMDGFALRSFDFPAAYGESLKVLGSSLAGGQALALGEKGAVRIMTGALIPDGADAVVPKELVSTSDDSIRVEAKAQIEKGDHIRFAGEELEAGIRVAEAGTILSSRWIGFLNGLGIASAHLIRRPKVALLVSGSELKEAGSILLPGQIHDSNGPMLQAALAEEGIACRAQHLEDSPEAIERALELALSEADLLLLSGGVSVGDADYSKSAFRRCGVETHFWGVAQKPGKPLFFGSRGKSLVFGLPGNPAAAWVCFHQYVRRALRQMQGQPEPFSRRALVLKAPKRDPEKTLFLKARLSGNEVRLLDGQQSHMLRSLAEANALAIVGPEDRDSLLEVLPL